jgi:hypothetical protein
MLPHDGVQLMKVYSPEGVEVAFWEVRWSLRQRQSPPDHELGPTPTNVPTNEARSSSKQLRVDSDELPVNMCALASTGCPFANFVQ